MEQYIMYLVDSCQFSVINEHNNKMIRCNMDSEYEIYDNSTDTEPAKTTTDETKAIRYFIK